MNRTKNSAGVALATLALLAVAPSCVSQQRHDEVAAERDRLLRENHDYRSFYGELEAELERVRGELSLATGDAPIEATFNADIDARMQELNALAAGLGGAPGDVSVFPVEGGYGVRVSDSVLFDSGKAEVRDEGKRILLDAAREIAARPYARIWVRGHTDADPVKRPATLALFPHGNLQLSTARAIEVAALLVGEGGLDSGLVVVAGFGPNEPVAANDSRENKQRNRRVEIFVLEDDASE